MPYRLPNGKVNPAWSHASYLAHKPQVRARSQNYYLANKERMRAFIRKWAHDHRDQELKAQRKRTIEMKKQAVLRSNGKLQCAIDGCGCDDLALLQANYAPGGHTTLAAERKLPSGGLPLYRAIARGRVDRSLFNFLCPPHNSIDHLKGTREKFKIEWIG